MDYKKLYAEKLVSAEKAASVVKSGDWVDYGWTTGTPVAVDAAIAKRLPELENVNFRGWDWMRREPVSRYTVCIRRMR